MPDLKAPCTVTDTIHFNGIVTYALLGASKEALAPRWLRRAERRVVSHCGYKQRWRRLRVRFDRVMALVPRQSPHTHLLVAASDAEIAEVQRWLKMDYPHFDRVTFLESAHTAENLDEIAGFCTMRHAHSLVLVSHHYHLLRVRLLWRLDHRCVTRARFQGCWRETRVQDLARECRSWGRLLAFRCKKLLGMLKDVPQTRCVGVYDTSQKK